MLHPSSSAEPIGSPIVTAQTLNEIAVFRLESLADGVGEFSVPGTQYHLNLDVEDDLSAFIGQRVRGRVHGRALRMHRAAAGGNFIEPLQGRPRIVQGTVLAVDPSNQEVILDLVVPIRVAMAEDQSATGFATGEMVNFYMEPGTRFVAEASGAG